jgi:hypothetical protein
MYWKFKANLRKELRKIVFGFPSKYDKENYHHVPIIGQTKSNKKRTNHQIFKTQTKFNKKML